MRRMRWRTHAQIADKHVTAAATLTIFSSRTQWQRSIALTAYTILGKMIARISTKAQKKMLFNVESTCNLTSVASYETAATGDREGRGRT
jgi:hypothetical protein